MQPMMECGHAANATRDGEPACVICIGINPGALVIAAVQPDLTGRIARCTHCGQTMRSDAPGLAFFEYRPDQEFDAYYNGCRGWD